MRPSEIGICIETSIGLVDMLFSSLLPNTYAPRLVRGVYGCRGQAAARRHVAGSRETVNNPYHSGFTFIEILVVLVIMSICFGFTVLVFGDFGAKRQARSTAEQIKNTIFYLREQAILDSTHFTIKIDSHRYQVFQANAPQEATNALPTRLSSGQFPKNITVTPPSLIEIQSSGNITPFTLTFNTPSAPQAASLTGEANGQLKIGPP